MIKMTKELKEKLLTAQSAEEAAALVKADGQRLTREDAEHLWAEIAKSREQDGRELSTEELDAVAGGADRNWVTEDCAATVEFRSFCISNDNCIWRDVTYDYGPTGTLCPNCGQNMYLHNSIPLGGDQYEDQLKLRYMREIRELKKTEKVKSS